VKRRRWWHSDGNRRGGGVSGGGRSRRGGRIGGGEGGEELELGCGQEENGEKRERVAAGGFSSASVAWGIEGKKEGALRARPRGRGRRRRGGLGRGDRQRRVASNDPRLLRNRGERQGADRLARIQNEIQRYSLIQTDSKTSKH
jgi:hypothetical protein